MTVSGYQRLRNKIFNITLLIAIGITVVGFALQGLISYSLLKRQGIKFGSFGFYLAHIPPKAALGGKKLVVLLGNSVYQYNNIPGFMQQDADEENAPVVFMNMAQISSSIYDYWVQLSKVVASHPDLVVFPLDEVTFSLDPKFKTDGDQMAYDVDAHRALPPSFYTQSFTYQSSVDSFLSTVFPLKRLDPMIRWKLKLRQHVPEEFLKWFSYPYLNVATDAHMKTVSMSRLKETAGQEKYTVLNEVLDMLAQYQIPALFIWQEVNMKEPSPLYKEVRRIIESRGNTFFADMRVYWNQKDFVDSIHPNRQEEPRYARRHYNEVKRVLALIEARHGI